MKRPLRERFQDPEYREAYWDEFSESRLAGQFSFTRQLRKKTQAQIAELAGMYQSQISTIEDEPGASELATLRRVAAALDVALSVRLISWEQAVKEVEEQGRVSMEIPDSTGLHEAPSPPLQAHQISGQFEAIQLSATEMRKRQLQEELREWLSIPAAQVDYDYEELEDAAA